VLVVGKENCVARARQMQEEKTGSIPCPRSKAQSRKQGQRCHCTANQSKVHVYELETRNCLTRSRSFRTGNKREGGKGSPPRHKGTKGNEPDMRRLSRLGPGFHAQVVDFPHLEQGKLLRENEPPHPGPLPQKVFWRRGRNDFSVGCSIAHCNEGKLWPSMKQCPPILRKVER
jgi:hypothetical protein